MALIPKVPAGCTLQSYVNALLFLRGSLRSPCTRRSSIFDAKTVSTELIGDTLSTSWIAMRFTSLPAVVSTLTEEEESGLLSKIAISDPDAVAIDWAQRVSPRLSAQFRVCRLCAEEDLSLYGLSFTRVLHQIPTVRTCPTHNYPLANACGDCGAEYRLASVKPRRRALHLCETCHSATGRPVDHVPSAGYAAYSDFLERGLTGQAPELRPDRLRIALDRFAELSMGHGEDLLWMLAKFWAVDSWHSACAGIGVNPDEMRRSLVFGAPPVSVLGAYGLASFFHSSISCDPEWPTGNAPNTPIWSFMDWRKHDEYLFDLARQFGMPHDVALSFLRGDWCAMRKLGYSLKDVRQFVGGLQRYKSYAVKLRRLHLERARRTRRRKLVDEV